MPCGTVEGVPALGCGPYDIAVVVVLELLGVADDGIELLCEFGAGYSPAGGNAAANWKVTVNGKPRPVLALGRRSKIDCYVPKGWGGTYP